MAAADWAGYAEMMAEAAHAAQPAETVSHDAEMRRLLVTAVGSRLAPALRVSLTWARLVELRPTLFPPSAHVCTAGHCSLFCERPGVPFSDPAPPHTRHVASGDVYVCATGATHVCTPMDCRAQVQSEQDRGTYVCAISGRAYGSMLEHGETFKERQERMGEMPTRSRSTKRRNDNAAAPKTPAERINNRRLGEARKISVVLFGPAVRVALEERIGRAMATATAAASSMAPLMAYSTIASAAIEAGVGDWVRMQPAITLTPAEHEYLARAATALLDIVYRLMRDHAPRELVMEKMFVPILYMLRDGVVGVVRYVDEVPAYDVFVANEAPLPEPGTQRYEFVTPHPGLWRVLPSATTLATLDVLRRHDEYANPMKRGRKLAAAFEEALRTPNPQRACLTQTIDGGPLRPRLLLDDARLD